MNLEDFFRIAPQLLPLVPELIKALATIEKLMDDPDIKEAIQTLEKVATIFNQKEQS